MAIDTFPHGYWMHKIGQDNMKSTMLSPPDQIHRIRNLCLESVLSKRIYTYMHASVSLSKEDVLKISGKEMSDFQQVSLRDYFRTPIQVPVDIESSRL